MALLFVAAIDAALTPYEFLTQDRYVAVGLFAVLLLACVAPLRSALPDKAPGQIMIVCIALGLTLALWWGAHGWMLDYPWTLDEVMARFDAAVFAQGRLAQPVAPPWREFSSALAPYFLLDTPGHAVMISSYMPVHAALRALVGTVVDPALLNPALAGGGLLILWHLARREFADCPGAVWVVLAGYLLSAQIIVAAMTSYAMTAHLVLNLAWLALVRRPGWASVMGALIIGFLATGLHQIAFHPLFVAPFVVDLAWRRQWARFLAFVLGYLVILGFWVSYPHLVLMAQGLAAGGGAGAGGAGFWAARIAPLLLHRDPHTLALMDKNLLRALCWNAAFLLPLMMLAWPAIRRGEGLARPLAVGLGLTVAVVAVVLPDQGHGWGYRYIHGVLGNGLLLAGHGYRRAVRGGMAVDGAVIALGAATLLIALPFLLWSARAFVLPAARLTALIERQPADFVILDTMRPSMAIKQVRNRPDLANRPLVLSSHDLQPGQVEALCQRGTVVLVDRRAQRAVGFSPWLPVHSPEFDSMTVSLRGRPCLRTAAP